VSKVGNDDSYVPLTLTFWTQNQ